MGYWIHCYLMLLFLLIRFLFSPLSFSFSLPFFFSYSSASKSLFSCLSNIPNPLPLLRLYACCLEQLCQVFTGLTHPHDSRLSSGTTPWYITCLVFSRACASSEMIWFVCISCVSSPDPVPSQECKHHVRGKTLSIVFIILSLSPRKMPGTW